jgi:hypothetical protein
MFDFQSWKLELVLRSKLHLMLPPRTWLPFRNCFLLETEFGEIWLEVTAEVVIKNLKKLLMGKRVLRTMTITIWEWSTLSSKIGTTSTRRKLSTKKEKPVFIWEVSRLALKEEATLLVECLCLKCLTNKKPKVLLMHRLTLKLQLKQTLKTTC